MKRLIAIALAGVVAGPVFAEGDTAKGEKTFKKCKACHMIVADDGTTIVKGGKTGPNLYGVIGRQIGGADFKYGKSLVAAGADGRVWDEESFVGFVKDPKGWLKAELDDSKAKSKMSFKLKKGGEDIYAYLVSVGPVMEEAGEEEASESN